MAAVKKKKNGDGNGKAEAHERVECTACGHSLDIHGSGKCGEAFCPCDRFWRNQPTQVWLRTKWAGRPLQMGRAS